MKIIDADKLHYKTVRIATAKGTKPALVVFAKEIQKTKGLPIAERHGIVRNGHWIVERDEMVMHCSSCAWVFEYYGGLEETYNYCPHCGANMGGVGYE